MNHYISNLTWMVWVVECWSASSPASSWSYFSLPTRCWPSFSWCSCDQWETPCLQEGHGWKSGCLFSLGSWECEDRHSSFHAIPCWGALWRLNASTSRRQTVSLNRLALESICGWEFVLTKYVGFDSQWEVRVISEDVNSFGDRDVLKVLTIDFHDLREYR